MEIRIIKINHMKNIKTKFTIIFLAVILYIPFTFVHANNPIPVPDTISPVITLLGNASISIIQDSIYTDAGATAIDDIDGDITTNISTTNPVNTATAGTYQVLYDVKDLAGNSATEVTRTVTVNPLPPVATETVLIRSGDTIIYQGPVNLPTAGNIDITDDAGAVHSVNADSVLGVLYALDQTSTAFSLSDLQYFNSFGSFYLKCITPDGASQLCNNWQYVVNDTAPATSMDSTILTGGENLTLYFGNPHQVIFDKTTITAGGTIAATAQKYNYKDNTWGALTSVTIGATQPNPNDPWNPTVVVSGVVDANGATTLTLANAGAYDVGIAEDFYFPSYPVTVNTADPCTNGCGGGGSTPATFSVPNALSYLSRMQASDGSFGGSTLYTDWAGIAVASGNGSRTNILSYMSAHNSVSSLLTDNERHAMALLALGQNPYSFYGANYIEAITKSFDGTQFGDLSLTNDDIFALIPLASSGYTVSDDIITKDITFIIGKQQSNGSWEGSVDLTAAAVQALSPFSSTNGVPTALANAGSYLQNAQINDGGWGNISSSSWAIQAMNTLGASWTKNGKSSADYLGAQQATDGAGLPSSETLENRIWATSYAIPAALGKPWNAILQSVTKPVNQINLTTSGNNTSSNTNTVQQIQKTPIITKEEPIIQITKPITNPTKITSITKPIVKVTNQKLKSPIQKNKNHPNIPISKIENKISTDKNLEASTIKSGWSVSTPIIIETIISMFLIGFLIRRYITKK